MKKTELHMAYVWDCDECGRENLVRPLPANLDVDEREMLAAQLGIEPEDLPENLESELCVVPSRVKCKHCGEEYSVVLPEF